MIESLSCGNGHPLGPEFWGSLAVLIVVFCCTSWCLAKLATRSKFFVCCGRTVDLLVRLCPQLGLCPLTGIAIGGRGSATALLLILVVWFCYVAARAIKAFIPNSSGVLIMALLLGVFAPACYCNVHSTYFGGDGDYKKRAESLSGSDDESSMALLADLPIALDIPKGGKAAVVVEVGPEKVRLAVELKIPPRHATLSLNGRRVPVPSVRTRTRTASFEQSP